ncbi:HAD family hydrolase [Paenibacillus ehimensis]|uniref:HAD family hydrolase n=1 Tax=Paenibacillus ehimensis TaxID=79264 RepID=UPI002DBCD461|nr:HAD family hydrolase [Paenibacillus ehimensis]MEC0211364.1 HAD family hydrolase [Paenibacillus ehimensis]
MRLTSKERIIHNLDGVKRIVFDIDGTLKLPGIPMKPAMIELFNRLTELVPVSLATARTVLSVRRFLRKNVLRMNCPVICFNGRTVYDYGQGRSLYEASIDMKDVLLIQEACGRSGDIIFEQGESAYATSEAGACLYAEDWKIGREAVRVIGGELPPAPPVTIVLMPGQTDMLERLEKIMPEVSSSLIVAKQRTTDWYEVKRGGITKAVGLQALCRAAGESPGQCLVFGDEENDCEMFEIAGLSVAVNQANEKLIALADAYCEHDMEELLGRIASQMTMTIGRPHNGLDIGNQG